MAAEGRADGESPHAFGSLSGSGSDHGFSGLTAAGAITASRA